MTLYITVEIKTVSNTKQTLMCSLTGLFRCDRGVYVFFVSCSSAALGLWHLSETLLGGFEKDICYCEQELHAGTQVYILHHRVQRGALTALTVVHLNHHVLFCTGTQCHHPGKDGMKDR